MIEILQFVIGLVGVILIGCWIRKDKPDDLDYPQDYMG